MLWINLFCLIICMLIQIFFNGSIENMKISVNYIILHSIFFENLHTEPKFYSDLFLYIEAKLIFYLFLRINS